VRKITEQFGVNASTVQQISSAFWLINTCPTALERAFQLAKSGGAKSIDDIKRESAKEHYSSGQITGNMLRKQLLV
jgi:phosphoribosylformimino-5-aminoimidazole carboxamide ribonucleotide (ProFAR) isomerase